MRRRTTLFLSALLFLSVNSVYSSRTPFSHFEVVATEDHPDDPRRPTRRIPKKSINIPEFKNKDDEYKKRWDKIVADITKVVEGLFKLELEKLEHQSKKSYYFSWTFPFLFFKKPFSKEKSARISVLYDEYWKLLRESRELFLASRKNYYETDPNDPMEPERKLRIPKKSSAIPEFKNKKDTDKKRWDDITDQIREVAKRIFELQHKKLKHQITNKERSELFSKKYYKYSELLRESDELFTAIFGS